MSEGNFALPPGAVILPMSNVEGFTRAREADPEKHGHHDAHLNVVVGSGGGDNHGQEGAGFNAA